MAEAEIAEIAECSSDAEAEAEAEANDGAEASEGAVDDRRPPSSTVVYTDGVCMHPCTKRCTGVFSAFVAPGHELNAVRTTREGRITNQTMELAAALSGLEVIEQVLLTTKGVDDAVVVVAEAHEPPRVYTSSNYVMSCMTKWLPRWERTGWITKQRRAVQNGDVLRRMAAISRRWSVRFTFVPLVDLIGSRPPTADPRPPTDVVADGGGPSPAVLLGMAGARQMLVESTTQDAAGTTGGCSKRRNVLCTWQGG